MSENADAFERRAEGLDEKIGETRQEILDELKHQILTLKASVDNQIDDVLANLGEETSARKTNIAQTFDAVRRTLCAARRQ